MPLQVVHRQVSTDRIGLSVLCFTSLGIADILLGVLLLYSFNGTDVTSVTLSMDGGELFCTSSAHLHSFSFVLRLNRGNVDMRHNTFLDLYMPNNNDNYHMSVFFRLV